MVTRGRACVLILVLLLGSFLPLAQAATRTLTWDALTAYADGTPVTVQRYTVYWSRDKTQWQEFVCLEQSGSAPVPDPRLLQRVCSDVWVTSGETCYKVSASDAFGEGAVSEMICAGGTATGALPPPRNLRLRAP